MKAIVAAAMIVSGAAIAEPLLMDEQIDDMARQMGKIYEAVVEASAIAGPATVIDGDTLAVGGKRVRLSGIDAPELNQTCKLDAYTLWLCGNGAATVMRDLTGDGVRCIPEGSDRYGRILATCYAREHDVGRDMVRMGFALAYRKYSTRYVAEEEAAKRERAGIWMSEFVPPWEWRAQTAKPAR